jgi:hypothetical protein
MSEHETNKNDALAMRTDVVATLHKVEAKVNKIYDVVVGNEEFDQKGLLARVKTLEDFADESHGIVSRVKTLEDFKDESNGRYNKMVGAFFVGGGVWTVVWEVMKNIFKK